jgi:Na+/H+ antiporter NhaD/arsenite permease-like protein
MPSPKDSIGTRQIINKVIILGFMALVGFALAKAIYYKSFMGITLAVISLGAAVYFLYILAKAKEEYEAEKATQSEF